MAKLTDETPDTFDPDQLKRDIHEVMHKQEKIASANQGKGASLKSIESERGYHMPAFKALMSLSKKSPEWIDDYMRTFSAGLDVIRELAAAGETGEELPLDEPEGNTSKTVASIKDAAAKRAKKAKQPEGVH